ncbi:unnamed protein product [Ectocarpus sp. 6 AP-2014]
MFEIKYMFVIQPRSMSVVANYVAPPLLIVPSLLVLYQSRPSIAGTSAFLKGSLALTASIALQIRFIRRCALGGRASNLQGVFAMVYPVFVVLSMMLSLILLKTGGGPSKLGVAVGSPVYQYRISDVVDRVRKIVGERTTSDDFRER